MPKGIGWKRFDHVSLAVDDARKWLAFYRKLFGIEEHGEHWFDSSSEGFNGAVLDLPTGDAQLEVLEPYGDDSFLARFLERKGSGVHHLTIEVEDIHAAAAYLKEEMGIEPFRGVWSDGSWIQTFVHPRDTGGVLIQLYEREKNPSGPETPG